jgi:hypothetical protein
MIRSMAMNSKYGVQRFASTDVSCGKESGIYLHLCPNFWCHNPDIKRGEDNGQINVCLCMCTRYLRAIWKSSTLVLLPRLSRFSSPRPRPSPGAPLPPATSPFTVRTRLQPHRPPEGSALGCHLTLMHPRPLASLFMLGDRFASFSHSGGWMTRAGH